MFGTRDNAHHIALLTNGAVKHFSKPRLENKGKRATEPINTTGYDQSMSSMPVTSDTLMQLSRVHN